MSGEVNRMDGNERFRQLVKSDNSKIITKLLSELGLAESKKLIEECYRDEPESAVMQYVRRAANSSLTKHDEIVDCCRLLLKYGADVNQLNQSKKTALHLACRLGDDKMVKLLLDHGADPSIMDGSGFNSLHIAVHTCATECVRLIIAKTKDLISIHDLHGSAPVLTAVQKGDADLVHLLVTSGADVNVQEMTSKRTPLHYALYLQNKELFQYLLNNGAELTKTDHRETNIVHRCCAVSEPWYLEQILSSKLPDVKKALKMEDGDGATPVIVTCQNGNIDQLRRLVECGAPVASKDKYRRCALHHCAENTDTRCAEYILRSIPSLMTSTDEEGLMPLHMAVIAGNVALIKLLLKRGANLKAVDNEKHTVLHWATVCSHPDVLDVLLENGADVNIPDKHRAYPVHYAAQMVTGNGASQLILKTLLSNKASAESEDKDKRTPVIWAASAGSSNGCAILVDSGADVNKADKDDLTALHCSASRGHTECVKMLVNYCKANMDPVDKNQCTPLFYAATLGHLDCLKMLLDLGADRNHTDTRGRTVVHCAVVSGSTEALQMLSEYNIDLWSRNVKGDQPIHEAAQSGHIDILVYLLEHSDDHHDVIDSPNGDGRTCLHIAALTNNLWLCKTLLDNHANVNAIMSNKGKYYTPLDVAVIKSHYDIRDLLTAQGGRPGHSIVDHAAETIQVKYKYHKKHSHHPEAPPDAHQQDHLEPRRSPLQSESHNTYPAAAAEDGPKYVDKSTQIRTKPVNKNLRKPYDDSAVEEQIHTKTSDTPKQFQKSGETERVKKTVSKDLTPVTETSSISQQSSSSHKRILSKQERIRQASQSVECKTPSEKSTSHGNTSDIESSSGDPVQTKAKAKRTLKSRRGKTSRYSDSSVEKNSSRGETEVDTSKSLSFPSLSEDSFSHDKGNSARDKGRKSKPSQETSQETEELFALASTYRMGCGPSRAHPVQYAPNDEPNRAEERDAQEMNEIPNTQRNGHASNGRLQYRGRIVVRNRNSNQRPRNHIKIIIKKNHPRGSNVPSSAPTPGPSKRPSGHLPGIPSVPPSSRPSGRPSSPQSDSPSSRPSSRPSGPPSRSPMPPSSRPSGTPSSSPIPPSSRPSGSPQCRPSSRPSGPPSRSPIPPSSHPPGPPSDLPSGPSIVTPLGQSFSPPSSPPSARQSGPPKISHSSPYKRPTSDPETISPSGQAVSQQSNDEDHVTSPVRGSLNTEESAESPQSSEFPQHSPKKTSSNTNTRIQSVRATVKKFEAERRSIRQLQQIKRMMIHSSPIRNSITFQNLLYLYARGHYADIADTLRRCTEQVKRADRNNQTVHHDVSNGQAELDYAQNKHKNVQQREADKAGHFGHHHSKSMEETKRHKDVAIDIERRPQTSHVTRRSRPTQDNNGYYNDPRLPTSLRVIKERQRLSNLLLKEAYQPFGGVDIFTSTGSSQSETRPRGRPDSNISGSSNSSSNSNTRQPGNSVINGGRKTRTEEITREKKKPDSIEEE